MLFSSLTFVTFFLPLFLLIYFISKKRRFRNYILLIFSLLFYAWGEPIYILLMMFSITINYFLAILIGLTRKKEKYKYAKYIVVIAAIINLAIIGVFKYAGFLINTLNAFFNIMIPVPDISLPIGISFYTFQILSYVIDVYRNKVSVQKNILYLGAYLSAFPQLIAGPIVRYETIENELDNRIETLDDFAEGIRIFIIGFAKKVLIANNVAVVCDNILKYAPEDYGMSGAWIAVLSYTLQIYYDFSGYSDMAIGLGRMIGFHYDENFNYPYIAKSITDFWRRWHISLSTFFKDYVYIPMGGNRVTKLHWIFNMITVWMLTGLWHGASFNFIIWGLYYGIILIMEKLIYKNILSKLPAVGHIYTIIIIVIGWALFRADDLPQAFEIIGAMFGFYNNSKSNINIATLLQRSGFNTIFIISFIIGIIFTLPIAKFMKQKISLSNDFRFKYVSVIHDTSLISIFIICLISLATSSYNPFIYFRF